MLFVVIGIFCLISVICLILTSTDAINRLRDKYPEEYEYLIDRKYGVDNVRTFRMTQYLFDVKREDDKELKKKKIYYVASFVFSSGSFLLLIIFAVIFGK